MGYESNNSLLNLKTIFIVFTTILIRIAISGFLKLVNLVSRKICDKKLDKINRIYKKVSNGIYFGAIISLTFECYFEFLISSYLTLIRPTTSTNGDILSFSFACVLAFLSIIFIPIALIWMIY